MTRRPRGWREVPDDLAALLEVADDEVALRDPDSSLGIRAPGRHGQRQWAGSGQACVTG